MDNTSESESQVDMFENTQTQSDTRIEDWDQRNFEYPGLVLFLWNGQTNPFVLVSLIELDPKEVEMKWLSGILSPASRSKHRSFNMFQDCAVSIFGKIHKSK